MFFLNASVENLIFLVRNLIIELNIKMFCRPILQKKKNAKHRKNNEIILYYL